MTRRKITHYRIYRNDKLVTNIYSGLELAQDTYRRMTNYSDHLPLARVELVGVLEDGESVTILKDTI